MNISHLELCGGGGGQALGIETAGFSCAGVIEVDENCCNTLRKNRPKWNVMNADLRTVDPCEFKGVELITAGVPCPPFSVAGRQLGADDERDMFPSAVSIIKETKPAAVLFENVAGLASPKFEDYRRDLFTTLESLGYRITFKLVEAANFGVPQMRRRFIIIALRPKIYKRFRWPVASVEPPTVGVIIRDLMASRGWKGTAAWSKKCNKIAPTIVGGSKKHGGPDLGPTRAKEQWKALAVDGSGIANEPPDVSFPENMNPKLTVRMVARIQSFPDSWQFTGGKTAEYRQVGNAFPPLVARALGVSLHNAFNTEISVAPAELDPWKQQLLINFH
ncbi:MAG: DNA cytosine methyltransferase [Planctomycetota bacterium]